MYQTQQIFCGTAWELEAERRRFYELVGEFNETYAMPKGIIAVPVSLVNVADKRALQYVIDENIRNSRWYLLLLSGGWGPVERDFRHDYEVATQALPAGAVAVLAKRTPLSESSAELPELHGRFSTMAEFDVCVRGLLAEWFEMVNPRRATA